MEILDENILTNVITKREPHSHKGNYGRVTLIGGNEQYGGAINLASSSCVYSGAGLVTAVTHPMNHTALHARLPEAMVLDWQDDEGIQSNIQTADIIVIGPGLGTTQKSKLILKNFLQQIQPQQWGIIDGSAITLLAENPDWLPVFRQNLIFTPHEMEWSRLSKLSLSNQETKKNQKQRSLLGANLVLKKHRTEIYWQNEIFQNPIGTPAMATGGMGDVLAGMIAGFLAQFSDKKQALLSAVYLHSLIGENLSENQYVALPTQIIAQIPTMMKTWENRSSKTTKKS